jgi:hypothetical protein
MRKSVLLLPALALLACAAAAAEPAKPREADRKLICQGPQRMLGSRIKREASCRPARAEDESADSERLPIGLQVKAPQREPGQRTSPQ